MGGATPLLPTMTRAVESVLSSATCAGTNTEAPGTRSLFWAVAKVTIGVSGVIAIVFSPPG